MTAPLAAARDSATLAVAREGGRAVLRFSGQLDTAATARLWAPTLEAAGRAAPGGCVIDLAAVPGCDTAGATLLAAAEAAAGGAEWRGAAPDTTALLARVRTARATRAAPPAPVAATPLRDGARAAIDGIAFLGEAVVALLRLPARRRMMPARDLLAFTDAAGVRAIPLVLLLGFLMGLILAFQGSIPLRRFGADIYVADLVTISLLRELGPLLASIILAGRTGSAFAAELGTMVVNEEVAAISTMGIDPVTMLVLPRLIAAVAVMPALTLILEMAGMAGMLVVMNILGFPPVAILHRAMLAAKLKDLLGGLVKALAFGGAVALIGCRTGLGAGLGPRAVGQAATAAVVGSIFATIMIDGVFTILYFRLGL